MKYPKKKILKQRSGMTLIEIIVAAVIIGVISSCAFAQAAGYSERARYARAVEDIGALTSALSISYLEHYNSWQPREAVGKTGTANGLDPIFEGDNVTECISRSLSKGIEKIIDPWGNPYRVKIEESDGSMILTVSCMNNGYSFDIDSGGDSGSNGGNNGNHNGQENGNGGVGNGNGQGAENGQGHNKGDDHPTNSNGRNGNNDGDTAEENSVRSNKYTDNTPISAVVLLH